jgi:hypothetical protein
VDRIKGSEARLMRRTAVLLCVFHHELCVIAAPPGERSLLRSHLVQVSDVRERVLLWQLFFNEPSLDADGRIHCASGKVTLGIESRPSP